MKEFTTSNFFVLRTPLFPLQEFLAFSEGLTFARTLREEGDLAASVAADRILLRARLRNFMERQEVKEALWLASPDFLNSLALWKKEPESIKGQRLERTLYRYVARMTSRPTPFGLFAGCSVGKIKTTASVSETRLEIGPRSEYWRRSRLDMEYLCNLAEKISSDPVRQRQLHFSPNSSLYLAAGRYHHSQSYLSKNARCYRLIATEPSPYLAATLERAVGGATPLELASALVRDDPEIAIEEAEQYIQQLIESQLLVCDLVPPITGPEPLEDMLAQLEGAGETSVSAGLKSIADRLHKLDQQGLGNDPSCYREIVTGISQLPCEFKLDHLVQVDMMKKAAIVTVDQRLIRDVVRGIEVLHSLAHPPSPDPFQQFKRDFYERYQDQKVPLVLALDDEIGIGFERKNTLDASSEPLLENMEFSSPDEDVMVQGRRAHFVLLRKLQELAEQRKTVLELDEKLLQELRSQNPPPLPDAFAALLHVIGPTPAHPESLSFYLAGLTGPSGALLLGRFCPADAELTACVQAHLRAEENCRTGENAVFAEIVHLPEGRTGNVLCRPLLRRYEIPFLATSRAPRECQIPITDLVISIENDRIVLHSQRLGCQVIPRLTSAHGYQSVRNLKLYKFLCLLQTQGLAGIVGWEWGLLQEAAFLPRVVLDNIVLSPARWLLGKSAIEDLAGESGAERLRKVQEWRLHKGIPRFALLAESDNQLLIDFENVLSMETFIEYIKNRPSVYILEMLPGPENLYVCGPEGNFTHELVLPFVRSKAPAVSFDVPLPRYSDTPLTVVPAATQKMERSFLPGSEWLFAKIYGSASHIDRLLVEHIKPLVDAVVPEAADGWFFLRYADPHWHLRLRFHGDPGVMNARLLPELWRCLELQKQQGRIWRMQLDTYEREIERYGGPAGMRIAERLFQYDSELALELLATIAGQLRTNVRWHLAFAAADRLFGGLGLDWNARQMLANRMREAQEQSLGLEGMDTKELSEKFRQERRTLEYLLEAPDNGNSAFPAGAQAALALFTQRMKAIHTELEYARQKGELAKDIPDLAGSYVHMQLNRIFRTAANAQEMVLYDFLARTYDSKIARQK